LTIQIAALLPTRQDTHPLGCHRPRIPDRIVFDKLIQLLVFGCGYRRIADATCSATTLRRRRDEWITAGVAEQLRLAVLAAHDRMHGLELEQLAVVPAPANRRDQGLLRWCTERRRLVVEFWLALASAVIVRGRMLRRAWTRYRWEGRPRRRP
jgi:hypothetical protein